MFSESGYDIDLVEGINQSKSYSAKAFVFFISIITLRKNEDALYPQFVIIATPKVQ